MMISRIGTSSTRAPDRGKPIPNRQTLFVALVQSKTKDCQLSTTNVRDRLPLTVAFHLLYRQPVSPDRLQQRRHHPRRAPP